MIISEVFGFIDEVGSEDGAFIIGDFGGRFFAETVANGVDVFGGSFKIAIDENTRVFVFDAGVFETVVESGLASGGKNNAVGANHFFGTTIDENNMFDGIILFESNNFGVGENHDAKFTSKITGESLADFFVFAGKNARGGFEENNFDTKFGIIRSDFAASGTGADNYDDLRKAMDFDGGFGGEIIDGFGTRDAEGF